MAPSAEFSESTTDGNFYAKISAQKQFSQADDHCKTFGDGVRLAMPKTEKQAEAIVEVMSGNKKEINGPIYILQALFREQ